MAEMKRTQYSQQGIDFATLFEAKFGKQSISGYRPVLREPAGETTGGGAQALQHMVMEPQLEGDPLVTVGYVNVATKTAKLRTYGCLQQLHEMRFGRKPFHFDQAQYQGFFDKAAEFMRRQGMQIQVETRPPMTTRSSRPPPPPTKGGSVLVWIFVAAVVLGGLVAAYMVATGRISY